MRQHGSNFMANLTIKIGVIVVYLSLNITLNILLKWTLGHYGFGFPLLLSACHMGFSFLALLPMMLSEAQRELHMPTINKQGLGLLGVGVFFAVNIGFNNVSLTSVSLSLNQVIRCVQASGAVSACLLGFPLPPLVCDNGARFKCCSRVQSVIINVSIIDKNPASSR